MERKNQNVKRAEQEMERLFGDRFEFLGYLPEVNGYQVVRFNKPGDKNQIIDVLVGEDTVYLPSHNVSTDQVIEKSYTPWSSRVVDEMLRHAINSNNLDDERERFDQWTRYLNSVYRFRKVAAKVFGDDV